MSSLLSLVIAFITIQLLWALSLAAEERRSDVRAVLGTETEPGFWPTRGRRGGGAGTQEDVIGPPPFWAHRGRDLIGQITPCLLPQTGRFLLPEQRFLIPQRDADREEKLIFT